MEEDCAGKVVYLDYNATTPVDKDVCQTIYDALRADWANPSSPYEIGRQSAGIINESRHSVAKMINGDARDIIFTSGGTESNNMVMQSAVKYFNNWTNNGRAVKRLPHVITSSVEHDSVIKCLEQMVKGKQIELDTIKPCASTGHILVGDVVSVIKENTCLVSVMMANNETGTIHDVRAISEAVDEYNKKHRETGEEILVHTDAAQAIGKINVDVTCLLIDYLTIVGHKFYGPRIGALYVRGLKDRDILFPMLFGGGQEDGYRPGTENTAMIAGLGKACELVAENLSVYAKHMKATRDQLEYRLKELFGVTDYIVRINGLYEGTERLPNTSNISICGRGTTTTSRDILNGCPRVNASTGAACHSQTTDTGSPILLEYGVPENRAKCAFRFSTGRETSREDIEEVTSNIYETISHHCNN